MIQWLKRKFRKPATPEPHEEVAQVGWQGEEVDLNPPPPKVMDRNTLRIQTLMQVLAGPVHPSKRKPLEAELRRRLSAQPREG